MPSRRIEDLHPVMQVQARAMLTACEVEWPGPEIEVFPTCTYRSWAEQAELWELGRTKKSHVGPWSAARPLGRIVTKARPGSSAHNYAVNGKPMGLAMDVAILVHGKLDWDARSPYWQRVGQIGQSVGLIWYGAPNAPFKEAAHFQHPLWMELRNG